MCRLPFSAEVEEKDLCGDCSTGVFRTPVPKQLRKCVFGVGHAILQQGNGWHEISFQQVCVVWPIIRH
jgi:hypothetical protein